MSSSKLSSTPLFLSLNLLFFTMVSSQPPPSPPPPPSPSPPPPPSPSPPPPPPPSPSPPPPPSPSPPPPPPPPPPPSLSPPPPPSLSPLPPPPPPPSSSPPPPPSPSPPPLPSPTCSIDIRTLSVCSNLLCFFMIGTPPYPCCTLIQGLVDLEASVCLCAALKANILGVINVDLDLALTLILNRCGRSKPSNYVCTR